MYEQITDKEVLEFGSLKFKKRRYNYMNIHVHVTCIFF